MISLCHTGAPENPAALQPHRVSPIAVTTLRLFLAESALPATPSTEVNWRLLDGPHLRAGRSELASLPQAERIELFLPPARVLRAAVVLPAGAGKQARKLLPFALDQVLLGEPSEQHLAYKLIKDQCRVAAVQREMLAETLNTLSQVGKRPRACWAADALVAADGSTLLWCGNGWARRLGDTAQWFDASSPATPPSLLLASVTGEAPLSLAIGPEAAEQLDLAAWQAALGSDTLLLNHDPLAAAVHADAIDLLQGEFASGPQMDIDWSRLKPAAWLAGSALALAALGWFGQWWSWQSEERALKQAMNSAFSAAFPGEPLVDAQLQLQSKLKGGQPQQAAVSDAAIAKLLELAPRFGTSGEIKLLAFDYLDGRISAEYRATPEQIAGLIQSLQSLGKLETSTSAPDRVRLTLTPQ